MIHERDECLGWFGEEVPRVAESQYDEVLEWLSTADIGDQYLFDWSETEEQARLARRRLYAALHERGRELLSPGLSFSLRQGRAPDGMIGLEVVILPEMMEGMESLAGRTQPGQRKSTRRRPGGRERA